VPVGDCRGWYLGGDGLGGVIQSSELTAENSFNGTVWIRLAQAASNDAKNQQIGRTKVCIDQAIRTVAGRWGLNSRVDEQVRFPH
jgi:hypothetical protein